MWWLVIIVFILCLIVWFSRKPNGGNTNRVKPMKVVPYVVENYHQITEKNIGNLEFELGQIPKYSSEVNLLYALRVSKCVPKLKKLETLASRYSTARSGAGNRGLIMGMDSPNYEIAKGFLDGLYFYQFSRLKEILFKKTEEKVKCLKTKEGKLNRWKKTEEALVDADMGLTNIPGINEAVDEARDVIEEKLKCLEN